jgi:hypothetical protein
MKAGLLACAAAGLAFAFPVMGDAQVAGTVRSSGLAPPPPPYAAVASARSEGFEPINGPIRRRSVYVVRGVNHHAMRVRIMADARRGGVLSVTRPHDDLTPGARKLAAQPPTPPSEFAGKMPNALIAKPAESAPSPRPEKPVMVPIAPLE